MAELPLAPLTAISAVLGTMILSAYFNGVGYKPNDFSALFGLGTAVAVFIFLLLLAAALFMCLPVFFTRLGWNAKLTSLEMILSQGAAVGLLMGAIICSIDEISVFWKLALGGFTALMLQPLVSMLVERKIQRGGAAGSALAGGFGIATVVVTMFPFLASSAFDGVPESLIWLGFILIIFVLAGINAFASSNDLMASSVWIFNIFVAVILVFYAPVNGFVPKFVATIFGVRIEKDVELRVPLATCKTIYSAVEFSASNKAVRSSLGSEVGCQDFGNKITARVIVRLGNRWLLQIKKIEGIAVAESSPNVTIPDLGTELLISQGVAVK